jgi:FlaA1/EpsC-like NDP-sugar epimerase
MSLKPFYKFTTRLRNRHFLFIDVFILFISPYLAMFIRMDGAINFDHYGAALLQAAVLFLSVKLLIFYFFGLYKRFWRAASVDEMIRIIIIASIAIITQSVLYVILRNFNYLSLNLLPLSIVFVEGIISSIFIAAVRFSVRMFERANQRIKPKPDGTRTIIAGAGFGGIYIAQEMQRNSDLHYLPVAFLDDDIEKIGTKIRGIPVAGKIDELSSIIEKYNAAKVIIAIPSASGELIRKIYSVCQSIKVEALTLPALSEFLSGRVSLNVVRKIEIEDLLRREPVNIDNIAVKNYLQGKTILVTGAGGSIGSELCRQIISCNPAEIILLGHGENSIFDIKNELLNRIGKNENLNDCKVISRIADIRFRERLEEIFNETEPDIVFHAAAHKHVPLMEENPSEAITNNILGTKNLVDLSVKFDVGAFVFISTDKAVNPVNVMGATKRSAEMIVLDAVRTYGKRFCAVRFGNVLGSRGSVLNTFKKQILAGGPVTITDPNIERYFMTIPEAVQLVLQASVIEKGGEVFVLDMGEPVKIVELAKDVIRLSGFKIDEEIKIDYVGLRPGEKLYEELFVEGETYTRTKHKKIMIASNASKFVNPNLRSIIEDFDEIATSANKEYLIAKLRELVPEFNPVSDFQIPIVNNFQSKVGA